MLNVYVEATLFLSVSEVDLTFVIVQQKKKKEDVVEPKLFHIKNK